MNAIEVVVDFLTLLLIGATSISLSFLIGVRNVVPMVFVGLGSSVVVRVVLLLSSWSTGLNQYSFEIWLVASLIISTWGALRAKRQFKVWLRPFGLFTLFALIALIAKHVLRLGEMEHSDSLNAMTIALIFIQRESPDLAYLAEGRSLNRGLAYPAMLALGPEGSILSGFTAVVLFTAFAGVGWMAWNKSRLSVAPQFFWTSAALVGVFSMSTPIFRVSIFYLNAHTLLSLGVLITVFGIWETQRLGRFQSIPFVLTTVGTSLIATARAEGVFIAVALMTFLAAGQFWVTALDRIRLVILVIVTAGFPLWWFSEVGSGVLEERGIDGFRLIAIALAGGLVLASRFLDKLRQYLPSGLGVVLLVYVLTLIYHWGPSSLVSAQWENLVEGRGGWASAPLVAVTLGLIFGWKHTSRTYKELAMMILVLVATTLVTKTIDGGFGRPSFFDSVNRMWLHSMPIIALATLIGLQSMLSELFGKREQRQ